MTTAGLTQLCTLIGALLGGPQAARMTLDDDVVQLATDRHQVGPIIWAAMRQGDHTASAKAMAVLEQAYARSADNRAAVLIRLGRIREILAAQAIDWSTFKGTVQAERLYPDPAWRMSSDIDLLVDPKQFVPALDALCADDFVCSNPPVPPLRALRVPLFSVLRDATLIAKDDHTCAVEVHARPFFSGRCPPFPLVAAPFPAPAIGPELVIYLIAHGAGSFWVRLKWLVDLVPALAQLDDKQMALIGDYAEQCGTTLSTTASLLLVRLLFPFVRIDPLLPWIERRARSAGVRRRLDTYRTMLNLPTSWKRSPLDNRRQALKANLLLWEHTGDRAHLIAAGALSSVTRRLAAAANRRDRGLTLSDIPPVSSFDRVV